MQDLRRRNAEAGNDLAIQLRDEGALAGRLENFQPRFDLVGRHRIAKLIDQSRNLMCIARAGRPYDHQRRRMADARQRPMSSVLNGLASSGMSGKASGMPAAPYPVEKIKGTPSRTRSSATGSAE